MVAAPRNSRAERLFLALCLATSALVAVLTIAKHLTFHSYVYDLGIFHQVLWNTAHGHFFDSSLKHMSYLGDHFSPTLALLAPLEWSPWPVPTLLLAQALTLTVVALAIRSIALHRGLDPLPAFAIGLATLVHPALFVPPFFDIHPEPFIAAAIALALLHVEREQLGRGALFFALALGGKEDIALVLAPIGVVLMWERRWRAFGAALAVVSLIWFALAMKVFMPAFRPPEGHDGWFYQARYAHLGGDMGSVAQFVLFHPFTAFARSASNPKLLTLFVLLAPFGLASLFGWRFLLAAVPLGAIHFLSKKGEQFSTWYQYLVVLVPVLAWAACDGAKRTTARWPRVHVFVALAAVIWFSLRPRWQKMNDCLPDGLTAARTEAVRLVPDGVSACADNHVGAHLAGRREFDLCVASDMARDSYDYFHWALKSNAEWHVFDPPEGGDPLAEPRVKELLAHGAQVVFDRNGVRVLHVPRQ